MSLETLHELQDEVLGIPRRIVVVGPVVPSIVLKLGVVGGRPRCVEPRPFEDAALRKLTAILFT